MAQKVAIARTPGDRRIANRVNAELSALGFEVELVPVTSSTEPRSLSQIALDHGAVAGLRASPSKTGIELWIVNPNTGGTAYEEVVTVASRNDELLALRSVEVLRARLLKLGMLSGAPPAPVVEEEPPAETLVVAAPISVPRPSIATQLLSADLGVAYVIEPSALSNYESARLGLTLAPSAWWSTSAFGMLPLRPAEVSGNEGVARVNATLLGVAGDVHLRRAALRASFGAGAALASLGVSGEAEPPYEGQHDRLLAAVPFLRLGASAAMADRLALGLEFLAGLAVPPSVVRLDRNEVARWGYPLLSAAFTVQIGILAHEP
ncbi:MAG TPA: hypothetical protein VFU02_17975 [Polyangiaceae bacterium]|nr:hypothetical protein [Polyangiaceae bacterium]